MLRERFGRADIMAVDICGTMIRMAREKLGDANITFIANDAETMDLVGRYDLITSNACFQWFDQTARALARYQKYLSDDGMIAFSMFGPGTFKQLHQALETLFGGTMPIAATSFYDRNQMEDMLRRHFDHVSIEPQHIEQTYGSLRELLAAIKYTGTRGGGLEQQTLSRKQLDDLETIYTRQCGRIVATYDVLYCCARQRIDT